MTAITQKERINTQDNVDTQLELLKYATLVQSRIKEQITSDYTLCKLEEQDKEGIINMTVNAYVAKRKITEIKEKAKWYKWNGTTWEKAIPNEKKEKIEELGNITFDMYMIKPHMTSIMNRNKEKNHLLQFLKNTQEQPEEEIIPSTEKKIRNRIIKDKKEDEKE